MLASSHHATKPYTLVKQLYNSLHIASKHNKNNT
jgi:hypothetical protein